MCLKLLKHQAGDSIIEVLIAMAIVSLILVAAYTISNKNTQSLEANAERVQAQHLVEAQIEALRAQNALNTSGDCFNGPTETNLCNTFTQAGSGATYTVSITDSLSRIYTIKASWTGLGDKSSGASNVTMVYRLD